jgi:hypothetical protein
MLKEWKQFLSEQKLTYNQELDLFDLEPQELATAKRGRETGDPDNIDDEIEPLVIKAKNEVRKYLPQNNPTKLKRISNRIKVFFNKKLKQKLTDEQANDFALTLGLIQDRVLNSVTVYVLRDSQIRPQDQGGDTLGYYQIGTDKIFINYDNIKTKEQIYNTIFHELVHAIDHAPVKRSGIGAAVGNTPEQKKQIETIIQQEFGGDIKHKPGSRHVPSGFLSVINKDIFDKIYTEMTIYTKAEAAAAKGGEGDKYLRQAEERQVDAGFAFIKAMTKVRNKNIANFNVDASDMIHYCDNAYDYSQVHKDVPNPDNLRVCKKIESLRKSSEAIDIRKARSDCKRKARKEYRGPPGKERLDFINNKCKAHKGKLKKYIEDNIKDEVELFNQLAQNAIEKADQSMVAEGLIKDIFKKYL